MITPHLIPAKKPSLLHYPVKKHKRHTGSCIQSTALVFTTWANYIRGLNIETRTAGLEFRESRKAAAQTRIPTTSNNGPSLHFCLRVKLLTVFFSAQRRSTEMWMNIFWVLMTVKQLDISPTPGVTSRRSPLLQHGFKKVRVNGEAINRTDRTEMESRADCMCCVHDPTWARKYETYTVPYFTYCTSPVIQQHNLFNNSCRYPSYLTQ